MDDDITKLTVKLEDAFRLFSVGFSFTSSLLAHTNSYVSQVRADVVTHQRLSVVTTVQPQLLSYADRADRVGELVLERAELIEKDVAELVRRSTKDSDGLVSRFYSGLVLSFERAVRLTRSE